MDASRYDYQFDPDDGSTPAQICRQVGTRQRVLELGCAAGAMSAVLSGHYDCDVVAIEADPGAAEQARRQGVAVHIVDLERPDWAGALDEAGFDVVLAADVLEHLHDPLACLQQIRGCLTESGRLVVSVPNIAHSGVVAALLGGAFEYGETGLLDRTHVHFFTATTLVRMLHTAGFTVTALETVTAGPKHPEFAGHWQAVPEPLRGWLADNPMGRGFQVIVDARIAASADSAAVAVPALNALERQQREWLAGLAAALQNDRDAQTELDTLRQSRSWRWTAPLRHLWRR